ncbi:RNA-directed DNA polymerase [Gossypium australe]|uniref:RNA-directed DNA polymerase n=1 Tax=Gossypium australe TaxID=47621 RepID=A0A5B6WFC7_9ROSI|nr:RNA-directed DNA polymerase [Gossypium australe]
MRCVASVSYRLESIGVTMQVLFHREVYVRKGFQRSWIKLRKRVQEEGLEKYLDLPMMVGKNKRQTFMQYVDRFRTRMESWNMRFLSLGGKRCFLLPKILCTKLERVLNNFLWRNTKSLKGIHWSLAFRDLAKFHVSLLAKQCWHILTQLDCLLTKVLKAQYYTRAAFQSARLSTHPSLT